MSKNNDLTLITGASSGIGFELAREFAKNGHPLVITATSEAELAEVARELKEEFGVEVFFVAADLAQPDAAKELFDGLESQGLLVEILVNNAGVGHRGTFWNVSWDKHAEMIRLNIESLVALTHACLPKMVARGHGRILNTASIAGFLPAPSMAVYHATKAFVLSFSEAVATELKDTGVTLTALCPGATDTDFPDRGNLREATIFQKGYVMAPQDVAKGGYEALMRGDPVYVAGGLNKVMVFSRRFLPDSLLNKINEAFYADVKPEEHRREPGEIAAKKEAAMHN